MEKEHDLFLAILSSLDEEEVLQDIVLIGGWCPLIYREYFGNPAEISMQRTTDLDFMVPSPPRIHRDVDVSRILERLGFDKHTRMLDGYVKYVHPDLEVEFLIPERGKGRDQPYTIEKFHINAQGLRYLGFLQSHSMRASFRGITINVPEPAAYVLHKFIISGRRRKVLKSEKDVKTAQQIGEYLLMQEDQRKKMRDIYTGMPGKWRRELLRIVKDASDRIHEFLNAIESGEG